jgi:hypothetical protein
MPAISIRLEPHPQCTSKITLRHGAIAKEDSAMFRHCCQVHSGVFDPKLGAWAIPVTKLPDFVEFAQGATLVPSLELLHATTKQTEYLTREWEDLRARAKLFPAPPYPYQWEGAKFLLKHPRGCLFDEMGLGKTVQALMAIPNRTSAIIVCPASLRFNWRVEGQRWRSDLQFTVCATPAKCRIPNREECVIMSPEGLTRWIIDHDASFGTTLAHKGCTLIIDEAHYYKNPESKRSRAMAYLASFCAHVWALTGTPLMNRPPDLAGLLRVINLFKASFGTQTFLDRQFGLAIGSDGNPRWPKEPPHADAATRSLSRVALRRTRAEVLPEIPEKQHCELHIDLRSSEVRVPRCDAETMEIVRAIGNGGLEVVPEGTALPEIRGAIARAKVPHVHTILDRFEEEGVPLVVASYNLAPLESIASRGVPIIVGKTRLSKRHQYVEEFQAGKHLFIGIQLEAGGTGITLTRAAHMLMVQRDWSPAVNAQAEDRVCRIGQGAKVTIYDLLANHPVDTIVTRAIRGKQARISATVHRVQSSASVGDPFLSRLSDLATHIKAFHAQKAPA